MDTEGAGKQVYTRPLRNVRSIQIGLRGTAVQKLLDPTLVLEITDETRRFKRPGLRVLYLISLLTAFVGSGPDAYLKFQLKDHSCFLPPLAPVLPYCYTLNLNPRTLSLIRTRKAAAALEAGNAEEASAALWPSQRESLLPVPRPTVKSSGCRGLWVQGIGGLGV